MSKITSLEQLATQAALEYGGPHLLAWPMQRGARLMPHKGGGAGAAYEMEAERQRRVKEAVSKINEVFGGTDHAGRQALYDEQKKAITDLNTQDVNRQFDQVSRTNRFGLARAGLMGGSADIDSQSELARRNNEGLERSAGLGEGAAADLRNADERTRQNLTSMAQTGMDTGQAAQLALSGLETNAKNAAAQRAGSTIGDLFSNLAWAYMALQSNGLHGAQGQYGSSPWYAPTSPRSRYAGR